MLSHFDSNNIYYVKGYTPLITIYITRKKDENDIEENFKIKTKNIHYMYTISSKLSHVQFRGYFNKTMSMYPIFKVKNLTQPKDVSDYFRRCYFLSIIQLMAMISGYLPQFDNTIGLIKIPPSKNGFKTACIIDDSTVLDKETGEIRDSDGSSEEHHRGHRFLYTTLSFDEREEVINVFYAVMSDFNTILAYIQNGYYSTFDPIKTLQEIVKHCIEKGKLNIVNNLAWEIHDEPHLLTQEERNALFDDYDKIKMLWSSNFITNNGGKLRIYIMGFYFIYLKNNNII